MTHQATPLLDRIQAINKKRRAVEKRRKNAPADKVAIEKFLDEIDEQRIGRQMFRERFLPKKI